MKLSFISTVYNEENTVVPFLESLLGQSLLPDEIVIVDALSTDKTVSRLKSYNAKFKKKRIDFKICIKRGNRSVGRNEAIKNASGDVIIVSDAGCTLEKNWVKEITGPFLDKKIDVVAGYYYPVTKSIFERCMAAYTSIMPDKVDPENFLPSSRSVGFRKSVWKAVGGYPERLDTCEDLVFARTLKKKGFNFKFAKDAVVYWPQRSNFKDAFLQFYSYAKGDGQAWYIRPQAPLLFFRYLIGILLVLFYILTKSSLILIVLFLILLLYILWAIKKNYRYVKSLQAFYLLPMIQFTADIAVLFGFISGLMKRLYGI